MTKQSYHQESPMHIFLPIDSVGEPFIMTKRALITTKKGKIVKTHQKFPAVSMILALSFFGGCTPGMFASAGDSGSPVLFDCAQLHSVLAPGTSIDAVEKQFGVGGKNVVEDGKYKGYTEYAYTATEGHSQYLTMGVYVTSRVLQVVFDKNEKVVDYSILESSSTDNITHYVCNTTRTGGGDLAPAEAYRQ